jgi:microcystin-dependent protein
MSEPFIGEIKIVPYNFAPRGWAFCNGQLLPIAQNTALFSLLGTTYGGDGRTTFGLPNLQGRGPLHAGRGPGLTQRRLGEHGGVSEVTLTEAQMPEHRHPPRARSHPGDQASPENHTWAVAYSGRQVVNMYSQDTSGPTPLPSAALAKAGSGQPHNNLPPCLTLNFCIALLGIYPSRS